MCGTPYPTDAITVTMTNESISEFDGFLKVTVHAAVGKMDDKEHAESPVRFKDYSAVLNFEITRQKVSM